MKLLFISTETRPIIGGVARALDGWMTGLAEAGHAVRMLALLPQSIVSSCSSLDHRPYAERWVSLPQRDENILDSFVPMRKVRSAFFLQKRRRIVLEAFEEELSRYEPDWVIFCVMNEVCCLPLARTKQTTLKCAGIVYGAEIHPKRVTRPAWLRATLGKMDKVIAISDYTRTLAAGWGVQQDRLATLHPALTKAVVDDVAVHTSRIERSVASNGKLKLLTICRLIERKGVQVVLQALASLSEHENGIEYHIVGDGPFRMRLEEQARRLKLNGTAVFHGNASEETKRRLLAGCDVFVMTPIETEDGDVEGFGIVYIEAGAYGKPVIGTRTGGVPDAVLDLRTGVLVVPGDAYGLQDAVCRLLQNREMRTELGTSGKAWAAEHSPAAVARRFVCALGEGQ